MNGAQVSLWAREEALDAREGLSVHARFVLLLLSLSAGGDGIEWFSGVDHDEMASQTAMSHVEIDEAVAELLRSGAITADPEAPGGHYYRLEVRP